MKSNRKLSFEDIKEGYRGINENALSDVLCDMAMYEFDAYEAAEAIAHDIGYCGNEELYKLLNNFFIGIFGWSIETTLNRAKEKEKEEYAELD